MKKIIGTLLVLFFAIFLFYLFNYEQAKNQHEFRQNCEALGGIITDDEYGNQICIRRKIEIEQVS